MQKVIIQNGSELLLSPQQNKEAPYAYLVPLSVAVALGRETFDKNKGSDNGHRAFGYADILTTLSGVQKYESNEDAPHKGFVPVLENTDNDLFRVSRLRCRERIKGTYIPIEPSFVNKPLWTLLNEFKNPTINEMYTCIRPDVEGNLMPTIVFRQIPFSTNSIVETPEMPLTKFLSLPRWIIPDELVVHDNLGRSDATRFNFIHIYGQLSQYFPEEEFSLQAQIARNNPIYDSMDIARSGIRPYMSTVACSINDAVRKDGARVWMEALADWTMGSQFTLNGTITCAGIQSPIAEGDNVEFDGIAFHVESVSHTCSIDMDGTKNFITSLNVTNGMPIDQVNSYVHFPRYPGFGNGHRGVDESNRPNEIEGDDEFAINQNPGYTVEDK